jgi:chemotaxis protein methyltransferase CheR
MTYDEFLRQACPPLDLAWRKYRRRAARHRLDGRLRELGIGDYESYLGLLRVDAVERARLPDLLLVTVSRFFRERPQWENLAQTVLPHLLARKKADEPFRAWSVGCCGGEEPYSLALLWLAEQTPSPINILATDIDRASLARARAGVYRESSLREIPASIRQRFFRPRGNFWSLAEEPRLLVHFSSHHFTRDPLPGPFDLILCRYFIFTYYRGERLLRAARLLRDALVPEGALMTGRKEELGPAAEIFVPWPGTDCVYSVVSGAVIQ